MKENLEKVLFLKFLLRSQYPNCFLLHNYSLLCDFVDGVLVCVEMLILEIHCIITSINVTFMVFTLCYSYFQWAICWIRMFLLRGATHGKY